MYNSKRGQAHLLEFLLVIGIALAGLTSAYFWAKPMISKQSSEVRLQQSLNAAKQLLDYLNNIVEIKTAQLSFNYTTLKVTNNSIYIYYKLPYPPKAIKGYWFPLKAGMGGIDPVNGTLEVSESDRYYVLGFFKVNPDSVEFKYFSVLKRDSETKCEKLEFIPTLKTNGNTILLSLASTKFDTSPCPVTIVYVVEVR